MSLPHASLPAASPPPSIDVIPSELPASELPASGLPSSDSPSCDLPPSDLPPSDLSPSGDATPMGPSHQDLAQRRQQLKARRKVKFYKMAWRTVLMTGLVVGTVRLATSPIWLIRSAEQLSVDTKDDARLSEENIRALLPVPYPQSLLSVQPEKLADGLMAHSTIEEAAISRRLIPPGLKVTVTERQPVAVTIPNIEKPLTEIPDQPVPFEEPGMIDAEGYWMPRNSFTELGAIAPPPALTIKGIQKSQIGSWRSLYKELARTPVIITQIDWTRPSNLTLQTELGIVHIGPYSKAFGAQLAALDQMRLVKDKVNPEEVAFIDLKNPEKPVIEILRATSNR